MCVIKKQNWAAVINTFSLLLFLPSLVIGSSSFETDRQQVHELMRLETEQLLQRSSVANSKTSESPQTNLLRLKAIYGVGKRVLAEVHWNGQDYLYLKGQTWPLGNGSSAPLRLIEMTGRCITLAQKDQTHQLCVASPGGE